MFSRGVNGSWGLLIATGSTPADPVLVLTVLGDNTGIRATLSGETTGTVNTLWLMHRAGAFINKGSTWVAGVMDVTLTETGVYYGYVKSTLAGSSGVSNVARIVFEGVADNQADDNIPFVLKAMRDTAVYWPPETAGDVYGTPIPQDPIEISVRYEEDLKEIIDANGTTVMSKAQIYADRDLATGGILMLGTLDDVTDYVTPKENEGAWEIISFVKMANIKGSKYLRLAYL